MRTAHVFFGSRFPRLRLASRTRILFLAAVSPIGRASSDCGTASTNDSVEDLTEMDRILSLITDLSMDHVNVSAGISGVTSEITRPTATSKWFYLHKFRYARRAKALAGDWMMVFGSAYTVIKEEALAESENNISLGYMDFAGFGRQTLSDSLFPKRFAFGQEVNYCKLVRAVLS